MQHAIPDKKKKKTEKPEKEEKKEKEDKKENKEKKGGGKNEAAESTPQPPKSALIHAKPGDDLKVECGGKKGLCVLTFLEGKESPEVRRLGRWGQLGGGKGGGWGRFVKQCV